jgi:phosphoribosylformylglycinamidine synthase
MRTRVIVLRAAGSNCDQETKYAFDMMKAQADLVHINQLINGNTKLDAYQILAIPGGFTYGDDISAGKVLANELKFKLTDQLYEFQQKDKLVIGICNGFQVLAKAGLLPKVQLKAEQSVTLTFNDSGKFEDRWIYLSREDSVCVFTKDMDNTVTYPVAHAEGKFAVKDNSLLNELIRNKQIVFRYIHPDGQDVVYPQNPNGSIDNIAGICDPSGRILGMMPHPERYMHPLNHPQWTRIGLNKPADGIGIFKNAIEYFN